VEWLWGTFKRGDWECVELTSLISCSISGSTDFSSEEDSSSEALSSSLEDADCRDLSLVEVGNFECF
jgi:hypothetical protein